MRQITFLDTEVQPNTGKILDIGAINDSGDTFHSNSIDELKRFLPKSEYICGHNIIDHDIKYLRKVIDDELIAGYKFIDTLFLSPLLYPRKPYHKLLKDDKLQNDELNNPLSDAKKSKDLFYDEKDSFNKLDLELKQLYYSLLGDKEHFASFFEFIQFPKPDISAVNLIRQAFDKRICLNADLEGIYQNEPEALAFSLSLIRSAHKDSITPPWVLYTFPAVEKIMFLLRSHPCIEGCDYCNKSFNAIYGLKTYFNYDAYRSFDGVPLQEMAVNAALHNKSILAIFPTGGGKSLTFQIPALMAGENAHALTVIISPLQSLMKDQVDNLEKKGVTDAVTINGLLDPIERGKAVERVEDGRASILYISPEALRSKTIEKLLLNRKIARVVIDEAHCFSSWGHDFRVDYLYIGKFIKELQKNKSLSDPIPISCFTATAKPQVVEDIKIYFKEILNINLELFQTTATRENLHYKVINCPTDNEKYARLRDLIDANNVPTIVYVARTRRAENVAFKLSNDGYEAKAFHGKMEVNDKIANQNAFMSGDVDIIVATSAFGMGVDKDNVGMVIHYEISDSLENYIQESGRAGRDERINADCYILFNEDDLGKHFIMLNQTKLDKNQIQEVWKAIKELTRFRSNISNSALEIARKAGWNEQINDLEIRVTTAISALEEAGYVKRTHNSPRIYATSILSKNAEEAILKITQSDRFSEKQKQHSIRIIKKLISSKSRSQANEEIAESRVDYISDHLGITNRDVIRSLNLMREEKILADTKDLSVFITQQENQNNSLRILESHAKLERFLFDYLDEEEAIVNIKEINEAAIVESITTNTYKIKTLLNFWAIKNWIKKRQKKVSNDYYSIGLKRRKDELKETIEKRHALCSFIINYLFDIHSKSENKGESNAKGRLIEFSIFELKKAYEDSDGLFKFKLGIPDIEEALFFLSRIDSIQIEGGFLVVYNRLNINRVEDNPRKQYKLEDYESLKTHYEHKTQQIHIVGEYAKRMVSDYKGALTFVDDYFQLNYSSFLNKYFPGRKEEISRSITPAKFRKLFGELSPRQLEIIKDNETKYISVAAGPGSGKTKLLVHKLASIVYMEDVKYEQLLMLTFSRAAVNEFKERLIDLIGNAALYIEIKTFHSFCFDLLGRVGTIEKSKKVIAEALEKLRNNEVEPGRIAKVVLVIDEAQDMDEAEFDIVKILMDKNPDMRIVAVGDDDQNIYEFRGSNSKYFQSLNSFENSKLYELVDNYRSKNNLVEFSNQFAGLIENRIKENNIVAVQKTNGNVRMIHYDSGDLIEPVVNDLIETELSGSTCVLTPTNSTALYIVGLLNYQQIKAKLIQTNTGFNLLNLLEMRFITDFLNSDNDSRVISENDLRDCKRELEEKFNGSPNLKVCQKLLRDFEINYPKTKYKTDLDIFIGESYIEDFIDEGHDTILVSTMHKAKGREFDNVFIVLDNYDISREEKRRQLYVALTRAKENLTIHTNKSYLDFIEVEETVREWDIKEYTSPNQMYIQLSHKDIYLGYFPYVQHRIKKLKTGSKLKINEDGCLNANNEQVLKYSNSFKSKLESIKSQGYVASEGSINHIVFWYNPDSKEEVLIVLPELVLKKEDSN
jgi:ATP-dependent DNA helicase RecQ